MAILYVDGRRMKRLVRASARWLVAHEDDLNRLNVFPVPDGDTGTNMGFTLKAMVRAISDSRLGNDLSDIATRVADSALLGARGNSGVILSQIFTGFAEGIGDKKRANAMDVAYSLRKACEKAYAAVTVPTEGTILTVVREGVGAAYEKAKAEADIAIIIETLLDECKRSLANTPNLLPALKAANVVDAGAMGFVFIVEGIHRLLTGADLPDLSLEPPAPAPAVTRHTVPANPGPATPAAGFYGYCNEFLVLGQNLDPGEIRSALNGLGDSLVVAGSPQQVKVHIHSTHPGAVLERCQQWGILTGVKIENMDEQHAATRPPVAPKETVIIGVAMGEGLRRILESLGCDHVIQGGQTMNPSVQKLSDAVTLVSERFQARNIFLLPNNGNVLFSAEQVRGLHPGKDVVVIPTRTVPEGFSALMAFDREAEPATNAQNMRLAGKQVKTGEVTRAVKKYRTDGLDIRIGDTIAVHQNRIIGVFPSPLVAAEELVATMVSAKDEIVSIYHGEDTPEGQAKSLAIDLTKRYPDLEVELHHGGQPHYSYIISIE